MLRLLSGKTAVIFSASTQTSTGDFTNKPTCLIMTSWTPACQLYSISKV